ncbi:MAG TPA: transcriptional repressor LexA [Pseudogracilibacillus sp.]|nr:transcriptional repressor LexA [Pseudogracilibacillus sp.]
MKLNIEQRKIIELEPSGHILVKGVAGSGKTTVAVHRASFLHRHYCPEPDDQLLIVTFNKTLLKYIRHQYERVKERDEQNPILDLFESDAKVVINNIDRLMFPYFNAYKKRHQKNFEIASNMQRHQALQRAILHVQKAYKDIQLMSLKNIHFLNDEVQWIKACDIPDLDTYQEIDRIGRSDGGDGNPQKLTKNSRTRASIFTLMEVYDELLQKDGLVDFKTMNSFALQEVMEGNYDKYTHILIDESQDLSKVQLKFLQQLHADKEYASIMFVADNTQSIYSHSWLGKGRPYTTIGYDMSGKSRTLSKNYRTTTEISKAAYELIEHDEQIKGNVDFVKPALIDRHGHAPIYRFFPTVNEQSKFVIDEIRSLENDYELRHICIVARERQLIDSLAAELKAADIPAQILYDGEPDFASNKVKLVTMHSIKGLEFKVIFLVHLDKGVIPSSYAGDDEESLTEERKLLYVGMTRANELLYMASVRRPSEFIHEIDNGLLRMKKDARLRPFQSLPISQYKLTDQIIDVNAKEEVIRQWLMRELHEVYHYPYELMTLEYGVQQFSKRGYVDIAVSIDANGKLMPYIFAEVKAFATGVDTGLEQLKSYMEASDDVRYGIVTDGVNLIVIDRSEEELTDIPPCQPQFLPHTKQTRTYRNFRNRKTYDYIQDVEVEAVEIVDQETNLFVRHDVDVRVPLVGDVAAGVPTVAEEHIEDVVLLPEEWLVREQDAFALRVTGDSMIDAGIEKGDIVIVHRQQTANNNEIVIALIGEEATMKKYMLMGNTVLLISENPTYEPIQMAAEDVRINGKVIGVLKQAE